MWPQPCRPSRAVLTGHQAKPGCELATTSELTPVTDQREQCGGGGLADPAQAHELLGPGVFPGHLRDVPVVGRDPLVQPRQLVEQIADDSVAPPGQILQARHGLAAHGQMPSVAVRHRTR